MERNSNKQKENQEVTNAFKELSTFIPISEETVVTYAEIRTSLRKKGKPIPENDIWIAAICCQLNVPLVSSDKHFNQISSMKTINW